MSYSQENKSILRKILRILDVGEYTSENRKKVKRVVLISPDFFPRKVSEISINLKELGEGLVEHGIDTHIIAFDPMKAETTDEINGVNIHFVNTHVSSYSPLTWSTAFSVDVCRKVADIYHNIGDIDLIHTHDWSTFPAGINLKYVLNKPLIVNFYSLEDERSHGVQNLYTASVKRLEYNATLESNKIHTTKPHLYNWIPEVYSPAKNKTSLIDISKEGWHEDVVRDYREVFMLFRRFSQDTTPLITSLGGE